jgi:hypothetical protein
MEFVIAQFMLRIDSDEYKNGHPHCQTAYINEGKTFILQNVSDRYFKIIFKHNKLRRKTVSKNDAKKVKVEVEAKVKAKGD